MDGLDLLKQHWNEDQNFPKIDKTEIRSMLHKSSSSLVKWIFIISLIELTFGFVLSLLTPKVPFDKKEMLVLYIVSVVFYVIIFYFIFRFFMLYRRIRVNDSVKSLMENIIHTRRVGENYIKFNIITFGLSFLGGGLYAIYEQSRQEEALGFLGVATIIFLFITLLFIALLLFIYRLLYGRLLIRLKKNFEELVQLENSGFE